MCVGWETAEQPLQKWKKWGTFTAEGGVFFCATTGKYLKTSRRWAIKQLDVPDWLTDIILVKCAGTKGGAQSTMCPLLQSDASPVNRTMIFTNHFLYILVGMRFFLTFQIISKFSMLGSLCSCSELHTRHQQLKKVNLGSTSSVRGINGASYHSKMPSTLLSSNKQSFQFPPLHTWIHQ